jgi:hypothetical protein
VRNQGLLQPPHLPSQKTNQTPKTPARPIRNQAIDWLECFISSVSLFASFGAKELALFLRQYINCAQWQYFSDKENEK